MTELVIHVGYPKSMSTSVQRSFLACHPGINYLGIGIGDKIGYVDANTEFIFEVLLKYSREDYFDEIKRDVKEKFRGVLSDDQINVVSSEHICMNFSLQGIDPEEKLRRLCYLTQDYSVRIVMITRDREDLIKSVYKELVRMGYDKDFQFYLKLVYALEDRSFVRDLDFAAKRRSFEEYFSDVRTLEFEKLSGLNEMQLSEELSSAFGITDHGISVPNVYRSFSQNETDELLEINRLANREMSEGIMEPFERHRNRTVMADYFSEDEIYAQARLKQIALSKIS